MKKVVRIGVALGATVGFSGLLGAQAVGAAKPTSAVAVYEALNQTVTSLNLQFTVPQYTCSATNDVVNEYANTFDENGGTGAYDGAFVQMACTTKKKPVFFPFLQIDGTYSAASQIQVHRGDVIDVSVTCGAAGSSVTMDDSTSGQSQSASSSADSSCNGTFMGNIGAVNKKGKILPLPTIFGSMHFSDAMVNGAPLGDASPAPFAVNYREPNAQVIKVGALTGGTAWANTQKS